MLEAAVTALSLIPPPSGTEHDTLLTSPDLHYDPPPVIQCSPEQDDILATLQHPAEHAADTQTDKQSVSTTKSESEAAKCADSSEVSKKSPRGGKKKLGINFKNRPPPSKQ